MAVPLSIVLTGCFGDGSRSDNEEASSGETPATPMSFAQRCAALSGTAVNHGTVSEAVYTAATEGAVTATSFPNHCLLRGKMNERTGIDGKPYAIRFEVRLPEVWGKGLYYQGGSGVDGTLFTAYGAYPGGGNTRNAILDGYATVTTDSGHDGSADTFAFGIDPQARQEYGYAQLPLVADAAKTLIRQFYGEAPAKSYFVGTSNGGRQAMMASQRYPELFDGIIAMAPGFRLAEAALEGSIFRAQIAQQASGDYLNPLTSQEKSILKSKIIAACDAGDGVEDGMVGKPSACHPDPLAWACTAGGQSDCLPAAKAQYVKTFFEGAKTASGRQIYSAWPYDPGMVDLVGSPNAFYYYIFGGEAAMVYTSPPTVTSDLTHYALTANLDTEYAKIHAVTSVYTESGREFTNAESPNMDAFRARGGKILYMNGTADWAFSAQDLAAYYDSVVSRYGQADTQAFARYFIVPGMNHGSGGTNGTDSFDAFGALTAWVEKGTAPQTMVSTARADAGVAWPGRTRLLCSYPMEAVYTGGDVESYRSFACQ